jgi:hypothetical protein
VCVYVRPFSTLIWSTSLYMAERLSPETEDSRPPEGSGECYTCPSRSQPSDLDCTPLDWSAVVKVWQRPTGLP